jgi:hypothetical protein
MPDPLVKSTQRLLVAYTDLQMLAQVQRNACVSSSNSAVIHINPKQYTHNTKSKMKEIKEHQNEQCQESGCCRCPSCDNGCCRYPGGQAGCPRQCVGLTAPHFGEPFRLPAHDTAQQYTLNGASVEVC